MMTDDELTEMVLRVMRQQLEEKMHIVGRPRSQPRDDQDENNFARIRQGAADWNAWLVEG